MKLKKKIISNIFYDSLFIKIYDESKTFARIILLNKIIYLKNVFSHSPLLLPTLLDLVIENSYKNAFSTTTKF